MDDGSNPRVVVLFPGALGDLLLVAPALRALRARLPAVHLTLAVSGWLRALAATSGVADTYASLDDADAAGLFGGTRVPAWFGHRPHTYAWIGTHDPEARARLSALSSRAELFAVVRDDGPEHAAVVYARQLGFDDPVVDAGRWPLPAASERAETLLRSARRPLLAIHAGAGSRGKRWARDGFAGIVDRWRGLGGDVIDIAGPADGDLAPLRDVRHVVAWPLPELMATLSRVDAYLGNDSGVSHLAAAADVPAVVVFGPTAARRWAPRGPRMAIVQGRGDFASGIGTSAVSPRRVWLAVERCRRLDKVGGRT